jgi:hypothetical protein
MSIGYTVSALEAGTITLEDLMIIHRILIGCTKVAYEFSTRALKTAKKVTEKRMAAITIENQLTSSELKFRRAELRTKLPEYIKTIDPSQLSDILTSYLHHGWLKKTSAPSPKRGKPANTDPTKYTGIKSYYVESEYLQSLKKVISKPEARSILFLTLLESRVIHILLTSAFLYMISSLARRKIKDNLRICDIVAKEFGIMITTRVEDEIVELQKVILKIDSLLLNKNQIEDLAGIMAEDWLFNNEPDDFPIYRDFYLLGGMSHTA